MTPAESLPAPRHIGVIMLRQIGDVLLLTPVLAALRQAYPSSRLTVLVNDFTRPMLENNPDVDEILSYPRANRSTHFTDRAKTEFRLLRFFRRAKFDLILDYTTSDRTAFYSLFSGARQRLAYVTSYNRFDWKLRAYTENVPRPSELRHQVERQLNLLAPLGLKPENPRLILRLTPEERGWAEKQLPPGGQPTAVAHFVANWLFKCWEDEKAAALIDWLAQEKGLHVWLTSGPAARESEKAERILSLCQHRPEARIGNLTLRQLAALIATSKLFVGVDSAPMHMAAALGVPTVAIFGPTMDNVWSPWSRKGVVARSECRCIAAGKVLCDRAKLRDCFAALTVETVKQGVTKVMGASGDPA